MNPSFLPALVLLGVTLLSFVPAWRTERFGYTLSQLAFVVPSLIALLWMRRRSGQPWSRLILPSLKVALMLVPMGWVLTFFLANSFYRYPNTAAVVGLTIDSFALELGAGRRPIPVEEYIFYLGGCVFVCLCYQFWILVCERRERRLPASGASSGQTTAGNSVRPSYLLSLALASVAVLLLSGLERLVPDGTRYPGYALYLLLCGGPWIAIQAVRVGAHVHRPAFAFALAMTIVMSIVYEPILAVPRGFWGYVERYMLPAYVVPGLPIEAVVVWIIVPMAAVLTFTTMEERPPMPGMPCIREKASTRRAPPAPRAGPAGRRSCAEPGTIRHGDDPGSCVRGRARGRTRCAPRSSRRPHTR